MSEVVTVNVYVTTNDGRGANQTIQMLLPDHGATYLALPADKDLGRYSTEELLDELKTRVTSTDYLED